MLAAWAAFFLTLLPVLGIAHNGYQAAADRYTYLACLGFAVLAGGAVATWRRWALWPAALGLAVLAALTWMQVPVWRSDESLWRRAVELEPGSGVARSNLGAALTAQRRYADAVAELDRAVALRPGYAEAWNNLGLAWAQQGRPVEAAEGFRRAVALRPRFAEAWNNLGVAAALEGQGDAAMDAFLRRGRGRPVLRRGAKQPRPGAGAAGARAGGGGGVQARARDQSMVSRGAPEPRAGRERLLGR